MIRLRLVASAVLALFAIASSTHASAQATQEKMIAKPSWATPDRLRGRLDANASVTIQIHLPLRDLEGAKAELEAVSDPASPRYGQYLTSEEFESRYSPRVEDLTTVKSYLQSEGFKIAYESRNRLFFTATATASDVERVFATRLGLYEVETSAHFRCLLRTRLRAFLGTTVDEKRVSLLSAGNRQSKVYVVFPKQAHFCSIDPPLLTWGKRNIWEPALEAHCRIQSARIA